MTASPSSSVTVTSVRTRGRSGSTGSGPMDQLGPLEVRERPEDILLDHLSRQTGELTDGVDHLSGLRVPVTEHPQRERRRVEHVNGPGRPVDHDVLVLSLPQPHFVAAERITPTDLCRHASTTASSSMIPLLTTKAATARRECISSLLNTCC